MCDEEKIAESKEERISVSLTERQWDHVVLSLELSLAFHTDLMSTQYDACVPATGLVRTINRYHCIHEDVVDQLDWE